MEGNFEDLDFSTSDKANVVQDEYIESMSDDSYAKKTIYSPIGLVTPEGDGMPKYSTSFIQGIISREREARGVGMLEHPIPRPRLIDMVDMDLSKPLGKTEKKSMKKLFVDYLKNNALDHLNIVLKWIFISSGALLATFIISLLFSLGYICFFFGGIAFVTISIVVGVNSSNNHYLYAFGAAMATVSSALLLNTIGYHMVKHFGWLANSGDRVLLVFDLF